MGMGMVVLKLSISLFLKLLDPILIQVLLLVRILLLVLARSQAVDRAKRSHAKKLTTELKKMKMEAQTVTHT